MTFLLIYEKRISIREISWLGRCCHEGAFITCDCVISPIFHGNSVKRWRADESHRWVSSSAPLSNDYCSRWIGSHEGYDASMFTTAIDYFVAMHFLIQSCFPIVKLIIMSSSALDAMLRKNEELLSNFDLLLDQVMSCAIFRMPRLERTKVLDKLLIERDVLHRGQGMHCLWSILARIMQMVFEKSWIPV